MYSYKQIQKGINNPGSIKQEIIWKLKSHWKYHYAVNGAYWTGNVGDRAIAHSIKNHLSKEGKGVELFPKNIGATRSNVHILGGGGVLRDCRAAMNESDPEILKRRLDWVTSSKKSAILGVGVPGFKTTEAQELIETRLANVDLITVRDKWSQNKLRDYFDGEIHTTACPAFLLNDPKSPSTDATGVNFRPWPNYQPDVMSYHFDFDEGMDIPKSRQIYIKNAQRICGEIENPVFIPFAKEDEEFAKKYLDVKILPYKFSVQTTLERISGVNKMVSMRYHSLLFSAITDTPVLAIAYQPKVSFLAERIGIQSYEPDKEEFPITFESPENVNELKKKAKDNFDLLQDV
ncbi:polysaccharide pyruvyl transferase family protein [Natronosalvus amylolyticus]|uniref:polysaccharide pyruvyl transferase family protein n=1 Tax=Natronosalvus amylolyticus TaxID=2961994 RepID=UPI0020C947F6|nr:polysaccharide pyruvyl transferase family protein [Natronosalvus amylolyticus]